MNMHKTEQLKKWRTQEMEYDFKSMAQPLRTIDEFRELQEIKGIKLTHAELFLTYAKYCDKANEYNKAYGEIKDV